MPLAPLVPPSMRPRGQGMRRPCRSGSGAVGSRHSSAELPVASEAELTELIALLLHAESSEANYRLESARSREELAPSETDPLPGARVEHFDLVKK
jgi:hypothetical protein